MVVAVYSTFPMENTSKSHSCSLQPLRSQPLQVGQQVRFSIIQQKAVDVEPADLQLKLSEKPKIGSTRDEMRDQKDHPQSRRLQKSIWALSQFGQVGQFGQFAVRHRSGPHVSFSSPKPLTRISSIKPSGGILGEGSFRSS